MFFLLATLRNFACHPSSLSLSNSLCNSIPRSICLWIRREREKMGEAVASSEGSMDLDERERGTQSPENKDQDGSAASVVRWERFLPQIVLRVLLVEADDSTRQIISALLRKCSYKVAAVPDGLKAWEVLKGRPHSIDLILTEVELPSISGFSLLTLIMEHEICKNIPVIMMSANDSVNTAYRCMLRGAADFLLKPVRKNELRNLWQHVWRRQTSNAGGHQDESVAQKKVEATAENNAASNHSTGYLACIQRNRECIEKGSDAQSSCTKPDLEDKQDFSQRNCSNSPVIDMNIQKHEEPGKELLTQRNEAEGPATATCKDANTMGRGEDVEPRSQKEHANIINAVSDNNHASNFPREAIDLIGAFDSNLKSSDGSPDSTNVMSKSNSLPQLNLSLKRSHHSDSVNQFTDERHTLNHSDASAFSRYTKKALQPLPLTSAGVCNQQKENETTTDKQLSNDWHNFKPETHGALLSIQRNIHPFASSQPGHAEFALPSPQQRVFPVPVPVRGIRFESLCSAYGSEMPPIFCTLSGLSPLQSPSSAGRQGPSFQINQFHPSHPEIGKPHQFHDLNNQNINNSSIQPEQKQRHKLEMLEDRAHFSSATDQSASSSFCNGAGSHLNSVGCGSNNNVNSVPLGTAAAECGNEECFCVHDGNFHQSIQREVALTKFRMKRKDRCFEKKVRYESRKKLAEQRPRVKGQFVRQLRSDPSPMESDNQCDNSLYG